MLSCQSLNLESFFSVLFSAWSSRSVSLGPISWIARSYIILSISRWMVKYKKALTLFLTEIIRRVGRLLQVPKTYKTFATTKMIKTKIERQFYCANSFRCNYANQSGWWWVGPEIDTESSFPLDKYRRSNCRSNSFGNKLQHFFQLHKHVMDKLQLTI